MQETNVRGWLALSALLFTAAAHAGPVGLDGTIGAEWGAPTATVTQDPNAPESNFGAPGLSNDNVAYNVYFRADANYVYGAVQALGATNGLNFANIYLNVDGKSNPGSDLGLEVTNDKLFIPSTGASVLDTLDLLDVATGNGVIEFALAWSALTSDPYGLGYHTASAGGQVLMTLSQSFGYSVAGGTAFGPNQLGAVTAPDATPTVPEPASLALVGVALAGLAMVRRKV